MPLSLRRARLLLCLLLATFALAASSLGCSLTPPRVEPAMDGGSEIPCDPRCGDGEECVEGVCVCGARRNPDGPVCGDGAACCGGGCRAIFGDLRNCGTCDNDCTAIPGVGEVTCDSGSCVVRSCAPGFYDCEGDGPGCGTAHGRRACGGCGNVCGEGEICDDSGRCVCGGLFAPPLGGPVCDPGEGCCGDVCIPLVDDDRNCGACGVTCGGGALACCGTLCTDIAGSPENCGGCGIRCDEQPNVESGICRGASCVPTSCSPGFLDCPGDGLGCGTVQDDRNCGSCGNVCGPGEGCTAMGVCGRCESDSECVAGRTCCDGDCVDLSTSVGHCGACGARCEFPNAEDLSCLDSGCAFGSCAEGFSDCDPGSPGCETAWATANCGGCGVACGAGERCNELGACACGARAGAPGGGPACAADESCLGGTCVSGCIPFPGGATDTFGYTGCSEVMDPALLPCPDISTTGTPLMLSDDAQEDDLPLGFDVDFYGITRSVVSVNANGALVFNSGSLRFANACLPTMSAPRVIAALWDDLNPGRSGEIRYQSMGVAPDRSFVVWWNVPQFASGTNEIDVTAVIRESGDIQVCYRDTDFGDPAYDGGASATIGIAGQDHALPYSCNTASVSDGTLIRYSHP